MATQCKGYFGNKDIVTLSVPATSSIVGLYIYREREYSTAQ